LKKNLVIKDTNLRENAIITQENLFRKSLGTKKVLRDFSKVNDYFPDGIN